MSTNKTENYRLHAWEPTDDFLLSEINENFTALDGAVAEKPGIVTGTYVGDGSLLKPISLGFTPQAVLVERQDSKRPTEGGTYEIFGGLALNGVPVQYAAGYPVIQIVTGGFQVTEGSVNGKANTSGKTYHYLAVK